MRRLYSTFPGGWPGIGLLILRAAVGVTLITQGVVCLPEFQPSTVATWTACLLAIGTGGSLLVGILTPIASALAVLAVLATMFLRLPTPNWNAVTIPLSLYTVLIAMALAFLGPGAFSLDARLFGRRKIIIPRSSRLPNS